MTSLFRTLAVLLIAVFAGLPISAAHAQFSDLTKVNPKAGAGALPSGNVISTPPGPPTNDEPKHGTSSVTIVGGGGGAVSGDSVLMEMLHSPEPGTMYAYNDPNRLINGVCCHAIGANWGAQWRSEFYRMIEQYSETLSYYAVRTGGIPKDADDNGGTCVPKAVIGPTFMSSPQNPPQPGVPYYFNQKWIKAIVKDASGWDRIIPVDNACPSNPLAPIQFVGRYIDTIATPWFLDSENYGTNYEYYIMYKKVLFDPSWFDKF